VQQVIETVSHVLRDDEPCYGLSVRQEPDGRFVSCLLVMRGGILQMATIDHGTNKDYDGKIPPLFVPSSEGENPVGLMLEMSEHHRHDLRWYRRAEEMKAESTLFSDILAQEEQALLQIRNASVFGPHQAIQRNGHSHQTVERQWMNTRAERTGKRRFAT